MMHSVDSSLDIEQRESGVKEAPRFGPTQEMCYKITKFVEALQREKKRLKR